MSQHLKNYQCEHIFTRNHFHSTSGQYYAVELNCLVNIHVNTIIETINSLTYQEIYM